MYWHEKNSLDTYRYYCEFTHVYTHLYHAINKTLRLSRPPKTERHDITLYLSHLFHNDCAHVAREQNKDIHIYKYIYIYIDVLQLSSQLK